MELIRNRKRAVSRAYRPTLGEGKDIYADDWCWFVYGWMGVPESRTIFLFEKAVREEIWKLIGEGVSPSELRKRRFVDVLGRVHTTQKWWKNLVTTESTHQDRHGRYMELGNMDTFSWKR